MTWITTKSAVYQRLQKKVANDGLTAGKAVCLVILPSAKAAGHGTPFVLRGIARITLAQAYQEPQSAEITLAPLHFARPARIEGDKGTRPFLHAIRHSRLGFFFACFAWAFEAIDFADLIDEVDMYIEIQRRPFVAAAQFDLLNQEAEKFGSEFASYLATLDAPPGAAVQR